MRAVPGLVAKDGAEGVYAAALADGRAVALKIDDGAERARPLVVSAALRRPRRARAAEAAAAGLADLAEPPVLGGGRRVGSVPGPARAVRLSGRLSRSRSSRSRDPTIDAVVQVEHGRPSCGGAARWVSASTV